MVGLEDGMGGIRVGGNCGKLICIVFIVIECKQRYLIIIVKYNNIRNPKKQTSVQM